MRWLPVAAAVVGTTLALTPVSDATVKSARAADAPQTVYHSPFDIAYAPESRVLAVSDYTAAALVLIDPGAGKVLGTVELDGRPAGLAWSADGKRVYVSEMGTGTVAEVEAGTGKVNRRFKVTRRPAGLALAAKRNLLLVTCSGKSGLMAVDLESGKTTHVEGPYRPRQVAVTPDESLAVVSGLMPDMPATNPRTSATVYLVDLEAMELVKEIRTPANGAMMRGVAVSPDGRWACAVHTLGRTTLPTTQLERGWVNTNAFTLIDLQAREAYVTLLLDQLSRGAADPWGAAFAPDGETLWVTLAGVHELARIDLHRLLPMLEGKLPVPEGVDDKDKDDRERKIGLKLRARGYTRTWLDVRADPEKRHLLAGDLAALHGPGLIRRTETGGNGPRGVAVSPDGERVAVAQFFTGTVALVDPENGRVEKEVALGDQPEATPVRFGEQVFHDATYALQDWLSCATCHPDGRADGLNWDLLNDGIGNPKNTRSLVLSHKTPPVMSLGVRSSMHVASEAGFKYILFREPEGPDLKAVRAYLESLEPVTSPWRERDGGLTPAARRGREVFDKAGCAACHPAPLFTDKKAYDVGTRGELDRNDTFDTPTLLEIWRTAPYLHDGSARTLREVLADRNPKDKHGTTSNLSDEEIDALVEYLLSL